MNKLLSKLLLLVMLLGITVACDQKDGPEPKPPTPEIPEDSGSFGVYKSDLQYYGTKMKDFLGGVDLPVWQYTAYDSTLYHSGNTEGKYVILNLTVNESANFNAGPPVGKFTVQSSGESVAGSIISSYYYSVEDPENRVDFVNGSTFEIVKFSETHYTYTAKLEAVDGTIIDYSITRALDADDFLFKDETFESDLEEDYVQDVSTVQAYFWGDTLHVGVGVWKTHIYGDGAVVADDGAITSEDGTYIALQYYVGTEDSEFGGTFKVGEPMKFVEGTIEPGTNSAEANYYGAWMYFLEDNYIMDILPITEGEITITPKSDGTYSIAYELYDDNPNKKNKITGSYDGEVKVVDLTSTGDYSSATFTWADNKYSPENKNWEVELISQEYEKSEGKEGYILDIVINTDATDSFFSVNYSGTGQGASYDLITDSDDAFVMRKATVREFKNGQETTQEVVAGNFFVVANTDGVSKTLEVNSFKTANGTVYDGVFRGREERVDPGDDPVDRGNAVFKSEGAAVAIEHFGVTPDGRVDWYISMQNKEQLAALAGENPTEEGAINVSLDLYIVDELTFEDGIPTGTYEFVGSDTGKTGFTTELDVTFYKYFGLMNNISVGTATITQKSSTEYKIVLDFKTATGETLTGEYEGVVKVTNYA